jgi:hypothetical protein
MYYFGNKDNFVKLKNYVKQLLILVPLNEVEIHSSRDMIQWKDLTEKILNDNDEAFAKAVIYQIIDACNQEIDPTDVIHSIRPIIFNIMQHYGKIAWPLFGDSIMSAKGMKLYRLQTILDKKDKFSTQKPSALSLVPVQTIIDWCKMQQEKGAEFIASSLNIFEFNDEEKKPSDLFIAILENFGDDEKVQKSLFLNIIARGWSGSLIPYLERDKKALEPILDHSNHWVSNWVKDCIDMLDSQIEKEQESESEEDFGIY